MKPSPEATAFLSGHGWLSFTSPDFRDKVLQRIEIHEFDKSQAVYRAGEAGGGLWAIVEGAVEIEHASPGAEPHLVHFGVPGFWFGEGPLVFGVRRIVTVTATRPSRLATLPLAECRALLDAEPGDWRWIALHCAITTDLATGVVTDVLLRDPVKRTAALLLRLSGVRSMIFRSSNPAPVYLSQEKLGAMVNLSRNSIIPVLRDFERAGLIEIQYGAIRVTSIAGLEATIARES